MNVVYCFSRSLYGCIKPSLVSLFTNSKPDNVYLMVQDEEIPGLELPKECHIIKVNPSDHFYKGCPNIQPNFTPMCLMKVTAPKYVPEDKVILLDPDTIILKSLLPMWNVDLTDKYFGAVEEYRGTWRPYGKTYYNSGVMLLNLEEIRKDHFDDQLINVLNSTPLRLTEQDAYNLLGKHKAVSLPVEYNDAFCTRHTSNPSIVHFAGYVDWFTNPKMYGKHHLEEYKNKDFPK